MAWEGQLIQSGRWAKEKRGEGKVTIFLSFMSFSSGFKLLSEVSMLEEICLEQLSMGDDQREHFAPSSHWLPPSFGDVISNQCNGHLRSANWAVLLNPFSTSHRALLSQLLLASRQHSSTAGDASWSPVVAFVSCSVQEALWLLSRVYLS